MTDKYSLDAQGNPRATVDEIEYRHWCVTAGWDTVIGSSRIGDALISTVFLGIDHQFGDGPPLLYETMIFGGPHDQFQERYATQEEAVLGYRRAINLVKGCQP